MCDDSGSFDVVSNEVSDLTIASIFIILVASALGLLLPLIERLCTACKINPFALLLGKTMGTGVVISVSLIHLLLPANEALTSPCIPEGWHAYEAFAYLFCCIGIFLMHATDILIGASFEDEEAVKESLIKLKAKRSGLGYGTSKGKGIVNSNGDLQYRQESDMSDRHLLVDIEQNIKDQEQEERETNEINQQDMNGSYGLVHCHYQGEVLLSVQTKDESRVQAYMMEFALSVHSILIGLSVGTSSAPTPLIIALTFHQFFEGIALGSRLAEATGVGLAETMFLACIFAFSAPLGIAIGIILIQTINTNSAGFLLSQGILDALCSGILLYVGFGMLYMDFSADITTLKSDKNLTSKWKRFLLFLALWTGFAVMAGIGAFL